MLRRNTRWVGLLLSAELLLSACAAQPATTTPRPDNDPDFVGAAEIAATPAANAYDLINRLRPRWLQPQRIGSISGGAVQTQIIAVYLDGGRLGGLEALRSISTYGLTGIRFYDATRAATVVRDAGSEPVAGAIVLSTSRTRSP